MNNWYSAPFSSLYIFCKIQNISQRYFNIILFFLFTILCTQVSGQVPPSLFQYNQSTSQAFYYIASVVIIDGNDTLAVDNLDWVGAFKGNVCVGSRQWNTSQCGSGVCDVPIGGDDGNDYTNGYMTTNDIPEFKIYDTSADRYYEAVPSVALTAWQPSAYININILYGEGTPSVSNCNPTFNLVSNPGGYQYTATMTAIIRKDGGQIYGSEDQLVAFDDEGNIRGVAVQLQEVTFGPYFGTTLYELIIYSNNSGDKISFKYYDESENLLYNIENNNSENTYSFTIDDILGNVNVPYELNTGSGNSMMQFCPDVWIGDGVADCEDQAYGCDLTCYDNDGGDCGTSEYEATENCQEGYIWIETTPENVTITSDTLNCFFESDLNVLQELINNSQGEENAPPSGLQPIDLGSQNWVNGRLAEFRNLPDNSDDYYSLSGEIPESVSSLSSLTLLFIDNNNLSGDIPQSICSINDVSLSHNKLCPPYPSCDGSLITSEDVQDISNCASATCDEGYTRFSAYDIPESVDMHDDGHCFYNADLDVLRKFIDNSQSRSNAPPADLQPLQLGEQNWENGRLIELCSSSHSLSSCHTDYTLSGEIPNSISDLTFLDELNLGDNQLSGTIPESISNLTNLRKIYLEDNKLGGTIPESICQMDLEFITLQKNQFCSPYPVCIEYVVFNQNNTDNCNLSGPWMLGNNMYMMFDGAGIITEFAAFNMPKGSYSVSGSTFEASLYFDFDMPFTGTIISDTYAEMSTLTIYMDNDNNGEPDIIPLYKVIDEGACKGIWTGSFTDPAVNTIVVSFEIDENGSIINSSGFQSPVTGKIFAIDNPSSLSGFVFVDEGFEGNHYTNDISEYKGEMRISGTKNNTSITGTWEPDGPAGGTFSLNCIGSCACASDEIACDGVCLNRYGPGGDKLCDDYQDCVDGYDEANCNCLSDCNDFTSAGSTVEFCSLVSEALTADCVSDCSAEALLELQNNYLSVCGCIDSNGDNCLCSELDACDICNGDSNCLRFEDDLLDYWIFISETNYTDSTCSLSLNCSDYNNNEVLCTNYRCDWDNSTEECKIRSGTKRTDWIKFKDDGHYSMHFSKNVDCSNNNTNCPVVLNSDNATCNLETGNCEVLFSGLWGVDGNKLCLQSIWEEQENNEWECMNSYTLEGNALSYRNIKDNQCSISELFKAVKIISISTSDTILSLHQRSIDIQFSDELHSDSKYGIELVSTFDAIHDTNIYVRDDMKSNIHIEFGQLTSGDVISINLDANQIRPAWDDETQFVMGNYRSDSNFVYNVEYLGDYNHSAFEGNGIILDDADIDSLIAHWGGVNTLDYRYELGPCQNGDPCHASDVPYLIPEFDMQWDIEDLMAFVLMWNWSSDNAGRVKKQIDAIGLPPIIEIVENQIIMNVSEYSESIHHIWFEINTVESTLLFESANYDDQFDMALSRNYNEGQISEWNLINFNGSNDLTQIVLGDVVTYSKTDEKLKIKSKISTKNGLLSSGSQDLTFSPLPEKFELNPAYPNPFNPMTTIRYEVPVDSEVSLSVFDIQGRLIMHLVNGHIPAGYHESVWDGTQHASGMYFIRMNVYDLDNKLQFNKLKKIMLVK